MYGVIDFYKAAKKKGVKPIIGCEVYVAARSMTDKVHSLDKERNHNTALRKPNRLSKPDKNCVRVVDQRFYIKPRVDHEL